jgi:hypothetical protein
MVEDVNVRSTGEVAKKADCSASYFKLLAAEIGLRPARLGSGDLVWTDEEVEQVQRERERRRRNTGAAAR